MRASGLRPEHDTAAAVPNSATSPLGMSMKRRSLLAGLAAVACLPLAASAQTAGSFPSKPIRILVPFSAGSGADTGARVYGDMLSKLVGQPVVVENRPGASGQIAIQALKQAPADGYSILMATNSPLTVNPVVMKNLPYDPFKDLRPLIGIGKGPVALFVRGDSPHKTIRELLDAVQREKRPLTAGNYSAGYQLINTWLGSAAKIEVNHVAYKGGAQMANDVIAGQLDVGAIDFGGIQHLMPDNRVRVLAITSDKRHRSYPAIPTMKESGFPDFETWVWSALYVRAETPDDVTARLVSLLQQVMSSEPARAYQATQTSEVMSTDPEEMRRFQRAEYERFRQVAEAAGVQPQ